MNHALILFDIDGTLLDARGSGRWAMTRAFETVFGLDDVEPFSRDVRFDGMTDPDIFRAIGRNAGLAASAVEERAADLEGSFLEHLRARLAATSGKRALPGVVDLLDRLGGIHGALVGLATGNMRRGARLKLESVGLAGYFELGAFGGDAADRAGIGRIARERFEERLGTPIAPGAVVLVGDSVPDIESARLNGYRSLAVGTGWVDREELEAAGPDLFVEDLTDFAGILQFIFGTRG